MKKPNIKVKVRQPEFAIATTRLNLSQKEIAKAIGVTEGWYCQMIRGLATVAPGARRRIVALLEGKGIPAKFDDLFLLVGDTKVSSGVNIVKPHNK